MPRCCRYTYDNGQCSTCGTQTERGLTMSKQLDSKWVVHIIGQDDIIDQPDELTALRNANGINLGMARVGEHRGPHDPVVFAVVKNVLAENEKQEG